MTWQPQPGETYDNLNEHIYHNSAGISKSTLAKMSCPAMVKAKAKPQTPAMFDGTLCHKAILEPEDFGRCYAVKPDHIKRNTKAGKEEFAIFLDDNKGKEIITVEQYDRVMGAQKAVHAHPMASELLSEGHAEQSHYWTDERTGELCKARTDWLRPDNVIVDLKKSASASPWMFSKYIWDYKYHWQHAFYQRGINADDFYFLTFEFADPFVVEVYRLSDNAKAQGLREVDAALDKYILCREFDDWGGYNDSDKINIIDLPKYARD